jgi:phytoene synthase
MTDSNVKAADKNRQTHCFELVRTKDHDRFLTVLFAPDELKEDLCALYAFNHEIAKISETVSEPMLGEIRLQWWREVIEGIYDHIEDKSKNNLRQHDVVEPLAKAIEEHKLPKNLFIEIIDGRTDDIYPENPKTMDDLEVYLRKTSSNITVLAGIIVGCREIEALEELGLAWGMLGIIRAVPYQISLNKIFIPDDVMKLHALSNEDVRGIKNCAELHNSIKALDQKIANYLENLKALSKGIKKTDKSVFLLTSLIKSYRKTIKKSDYNPFKIFESPDGFSRHLRLLYSALFGVI